MLAPSSLPFDGGRLFAGAFWVTFVFWNGAELFLNVKQRSTSSGRADRGSFRLLAAAMAAAFTLDFACALLLPSAAMTGMARPAFAAGLCCVLAGAALRWYAVATLKQYFTVDVVAQPSQPVIEAGPYRYIRHPAYTGMLLALIGFALALGNWLGLVVMVALPGSAFAYRIAVEEAVLLSTLGEPYARYMRHTWRMIPLLV